MTVVDVSEAGSAVWSWKVAGLALRCCCLSFFSALLFASMAACAACCFWISDSSAALNGQSFGIPGSRRVSTWTTPRTARGQYCHERACVGCCGCVGWEWADSMSGVWFWLLASLSS